MRKSNFISPVKSKPGNLANPEPPVSAHQRPQPLGACSKQVKPKTEYTATLSINPILLENLFLTVSLIINTTSQISV